MKLAKVSGESLAYRLNAVATLLTIVTCRFAALGWISYGIVTSYHRFSQAFLYPLSVSIAVMWAIYVASFYHILVAEFLSRKPEIDASKVSNNGPVLNGGPTQNLEAKSK